MLVYSVWSVLSLSFFNLPIKSPPPPTMSAHNWCFASTRDRFVSGAACPGNASASARPPRPGSPSAASSVRPPSGDRDGRVSEADVEEWAAFMKSKGVSRVVCLLTGSELLSYDEGGLLAFLDRHFTRVVAVPDISGPSSRSQLLDALREAEEAGDHVVVHCSAGIARTGIVLALWLHHRYGVPVQDAVNEVTTHAAEHGATRKPASSGVLRILGKSEGATASGLPPRRGGSLSARSGSSFSSKMASDSGSLTSRRVPPEGVPPMTARGFHTPRTNAFMSVAPSNSSSSAITPTPRARARCPSLEWPLCRPAAPLTKNTRNQLADMVRNCRRLPCRTARYETPLMFH